MTDNILAPQAAQFLSESIHEILAGYQVNQAVADKISMLILERFNKKIITFFTMSARNNEVAIMNEALAQCKDQVN